MLHGNNTDSMQMIITVERLGYQSYSFAIMLYLLKVSMA